jgi:hypothetical protein
MNRQAVVAGSSHYNRPHFETALHVETQLKLRAMRDVAFVA